MSKIVNLTLQSKYQIVSMNGFEKGRFICDHCHIDYRSRHNLLRHRLDPVACLLQRKRRKSQRLSTDVKQPEPISSVIRCQLCGFTTDEMKEIREHMKKSHPDVLKMDVKEQKSIEMTNTNNNDASPSSSSQSTSRTTRSSVKRAPRHVYNSSELRMLDFKSQNRVKKPKTVSEPTPQPTSIAVVQPMPTERRPNYSPLFKDLKRCRVCLRTETDIALEKADEVHDFVVKCLAKINTSTAAALGFLDDGSGKMKIPLFFCQPCQMKVQVAAKLIEDLKSADEHFNTVLRTLLSLGKAEMLRK